MDNSTKFWQPLKQLRAWLPPLQREIWILASGQLLLFIGQGFTLVYASIYFVNELGFSTTQVGIAQGGAGVAGIAGRFFAGTAVNARWLGRRGTLLVSAVIAAIGSLILAFAQTLPLLVAGNLCLGLGISLYWPAMLTVTTDLTEPAYRTEAMALTRLADSLGLGIGALIAGQYIAAAGSYPVLFICKGVAYLIFGGMIFTTIPETRREDVPARMSLGDWGEALRDRTLIIYLVANVFFTLYAAQSNTTLPIYLTNFIPGGNTDTGFSERSISYFFVWHVMLKVLFQLPLTRWLRPRSHSFLMMTALVLWCSAFVLLWLSGMAASGVTLLVIAAFGILAIAEVLYAPSASALVGDLAPVSLRGIYFSLESQCWAIGFSIGPVVGGWALDHPDAVGQDLWLYCVLSAVIAGGLLNILRQQVAERTDANTGRLMTASADAEP